MASVHMQSEQRMAAAGDGVVFYQLTRKRVKNLNLRVERDGSVHVSAPQRTPLAYIDAFVAQKAGFIRQAQERLLREQSRIDTMPNVPEAMCRQRFQDAIDALLPLFDGCGLPPITLKLRTMKSRWGSCAWGKGVVTLNRRLYFAPPECLEYVALHELCHLLVHDHSPRFHRLLDRLMPDWKTRKAKLEGWNSGE